MAQWYAFWNMYFVSARPHFAEGGTVVCFLEISLNILLKEPHFVTQGGLLSWNIL